MASPRGFRVLGPDCFQFFQIRLSALKIKLGVRDNRAARVIVPGFNPAEINPSAGFKNQVRE